MLLQSLWHLSHIIHEYFLEDFDRELWTIFFNCAFALLMQPSLQLELFSPNKRSRIVRVYGDMRIESKCLIRLMWSYLGESCVHKSGLTLFLGCPCSKRVFISGCKSILGYYPLPSFNLSTHVQITSVAPTTRPTTGGLVGAFEPFNSNRIIVIDLKESAK